MPPVEVKVDFDVDNGDYKQFIKELREKLADNPDHRLVKKQSVVLADDPTLLPKQEDGEPDKWIYIKLSVEGPRGNITLAVRGDNVYLLGFMNHRNVWYEGNIRGSASKGKNIIEPNHLLENSTFVGYFFRYGELMGKSRWDKYKLGKISVSQAVRVLSKYNGKWRKGNEIKKYLVKLIVMICECARMHPLNEIVENGWDEVKEAIITGKENGWDEPKEAIITGEEDGWDEPEEAIITNNEDGGNKPEEAILTGEEDGYIHNWKNMSRAMMGWLEYPISLPENIMIKNHADARKVVHLILNSPMLGKEQGPDVYTKDESPPPDDRNDPSQRKNRGGHGRGSGGSGGRTMNGGRGSGGGGDQTGGSGSAGGKSKGKGKGYAGRSLVEVFALHDDAEIPFVGSIIVFDGRSGQIIYSNEEKEDTPIKDMKQGDLVLTGPCRGISANGRVGLKITGTAKNDVLVWDPYAEAGHQYQYDQLLTKKITGSLELRYAVLSSAVEARVQVHVFLFGNSNTAVYGQITAQSQLASGEEGSVVLFNSLVPVGLLPSSAGSAIPLTRSVVTRHVDSPLEINLEKVRFGNDDALFEGMKFSFNDQKEKVHFQTLEGIGYVRVSVDDTREYRDGPETSLPRSLTNQLIKMNPDMSKVLTELLDVHPSQLCFEPNKLMTCLIHLTNKTDDQRVYFSFCAGKGIWEVSGALPPDSTSTYLLRLEPEHQRPSKEYELPLILQSWVALEEEKGEEDEEDEDEDEEDDDKYLSVPTAPANAEKVTLMATVSGQVEEAMTSEGRQQEIKIIGEQRDGHNILSMEVLTQEQEQCTLEMQHEMTDGVQDVQMGRSMEVVAEEEQNTLPKQREIEIEIHDDGHIYIR